jgi:hypothetical protein
MKRLNELEEMKKR